MEEIMEGNQTHQKIWHIIAIQMHRGDVGGDQIHQNIWHILPVQAHGETLE